MAPQENPSGRNSSTQPRSAALDLRLGDDEIVIRNRYEALSISNDVLIGLFFVAGSILFLWETTTTLATWLFIVGSVEFLGRPVIRLTRHIHLKKISAQPAHYDADGDY